MIEKYPFPALCTRWDLVENLKFMYSLIVATETLLEVAGFHEKLEEEKGHAEWLKRDLEAMGETVPTIDHDAACIAGAQYYYVNHVHPKMLLGYMLVMEGRPMELETVDAIEEAWGEIPVLRHHAKADIEHGAEIRRQIGELEPDLKRKVLYNAENTAYLIQGVLRKRVGHA